MALIDGYNDTILILAIVFTVLLAIVNIMQIVMARKGVNPLMAEGNEKYVFIIVMIALIALLIAHLATSIKDGVGTKDTMLMAGGGIALVFAIITTGCFMMKDKLVAKFADNAQYIYFACLAITWICIIIHIYARATGKF